MFSTLVDVPTAWQGLNKDWLFVDCRFNLADTDAGEAEYRAGHIPGAVYAHLDRDLSGPPLTDHGRHPLPSPAQMTRLFGRLGVAGGRQVVAYDDSRGVFASRLWWMLRYMGHDNAAVLDGGLQAWIEAGYGLEGGEVKGRPTLFTGEPRHDRLVQIEDVAGASLLLDARAPERFRGETEPLDARAGHIPGARNYPYHENYDGSGRFLPRSVLKDRLAIILGSAPVEEAVYYCGSGVSACVNLLATEHAGLGQARLYVGSWSEWSRDPIRPAATGPGQSRENN